MPEAIFYDPLRRRWKRTRRAFDVFAVAVTLLVVYFIVASLRPVKLSELLLPAPKRPYHALKEKERRHAKPRPKSRRRSKLPPTQVALNVSGEGIRGAFYVTWDAASYASLREYVNQIDLLFPEWLHVLTPDGRLQAVGPDNVLFDVVQNGSVRPVDDKVMPLMRAEKAETEVLPLINNFDPLRNKWTSSEFLNDAEARARLRQQLASFLSSDNYRGTIVDLEGFGASLQPGYEALLTELEQDLHSRGMKLYVAVPVNNDDFRYSYIAGHSDGVVLMNYDEHYAQGLPGPIASQEWFFKNLEDALKQIPADKLICAIANYGYDWPLREVGRGKRRHRVSAGQARSISAQEAWLASRDSESDIEFDSDVLNPHFAYVEDPDLVHEVWYTDAATALNEMRAAQRLGINTFAMWRLGSEDRSLWSVWDQPQDTLAAEKLRVVPPGQDVDMEGDGEILRITSRPEKGERSLTLDSATGMITDETFKSMPTPYEITQYGATPKQIALTFDDGPDPKFTPRVLNILKAENVRATFFLVGMQAEKYPRLAQRIYREGHEIGNHTWTHPDISSLSKAYMGLELNLTERFFASKIGVKPLLFRPPYSIDQEPDTSDQVRPLEVAQQMGYITIGDKIDPNDWKQNPRRSAEQITQSMLAQLDRGNVVLLHDGGGDRSETVRALPMIIHELRDRGYQIVPVSQLLGKTHADVMPQISSSERWSARLTNLGFLIYGSIYGAIVLVFFTGDALMTLRLVSIGAFATYDRFRSRRVDQAAVAAFRPPVAVLIPAYNEDKVIVRTVQAVLRSDYENLRVIVIDDGSTDNTLQVARAAFADEIATGRVLVLTKPNSGKADALNCGLAHVHEEIYVGIDADTIIAPTAISLLVPHFLNPRVGALAGNAKVGNRVNLWTRWQALEYITSQNFERRALNTFGAVSVVPGAIGAWRTAAVREANGYHRDTVAEDADLTMRLLRNGYRVEYEDRALAFTEAPSTAKGLMRQRFRWSFGILQSVWKHRAVFTRKGVLGWVALPNIVIFQILLPLVSPFIDIMFVGGVLGYLMDKHFHPESANAASLEKLVVFFVAFLVIDFIASAIAFALERRGADRRENLWLLAHVWLQRFAYRQLFSWVLFKTLKYALEGGHFAWDKLERTAAVQFTHIEEPALPRK
ncbi:MAG: glycosyltransferase [Terriglobales bacterium]